MLKLLLDGTFPIHLSRRLKDEGMNVDRLIVVGRATETYITDRLSREDDAVFVTEDPGRKTLALENRGPVIISLVPQALPFGRAAGALGRRAGIVCGSTTAW